MQFFADQQCDAVVLETGLGGRLDSTNVCHPELCIVTNISLDHTKQLGNRLEKIAFEKAGIIKPNVPVVNGVSGSPCQAVVEEVASERNSPLWQRNRDFSIRQHDDGVHFDFSMVTPEGDVCIRDLRLGMLGSHQFDNAALVIAALVELRQKGWKVDDEAIRAGLLKSRLAGRLEKVSSEPTVILDMAHNPASVSALSDYLSNSSLPFQQASKRTLIFATTKDKDCEKMLTSLLPLFDQIVFTRYQNNPRSMPVDDLVAASDRLGFSDNVSVIPTPMEAWSQVFSQTTSEDFICIAGSAFLLAELRASVIADCNRQ